MQDHNFEMMVLGYYNSGLFIPEDDEEMAFLRAARIRVATRIRAASEKKRCAPVNMPGQSDICAVENISAQELRRRIIIFTIGCVTFL